MMESSKTRNNYICDIIYNLYKDNIFQSKKEIKFISITAKSFIKNTEKFGHCMEVIDSAVKPDKISCRKKKLDRAEIIFLLLSLTSSAS